MRIVFIFSAHCFYIQCALFLYSVRIPINYMLIRKERTMIRRIRRKRINEWTEHDLDQYVDLWFDNFASSTDFETMDRIALGRVPVRVLQDCLDSLANDYGIGEYKVNLYSDDIRNRIVELAEEDLEKWEEDEDEEIDESVRRRRNLRRVIESRRLRRR